MFLKGNPKEVRECNNGIGFESDEAPEDQVSRCQRFMITSRVCIDMLGKFELKEIAINQNIA